MPQYLANSFRAMLPKVLVNTQIDHMHSLFRNSKLLDDILLGGNTHGNNSISICCGSSVKLVAFLTGILLKQ